MSTTYLIVRVNNFEEAIDAVKNELKVDEVGYTDSDYSWGNTTPDLYREIVRDNDSKLSYVNSFKPDDCCNKNILHTNVILWGKQDSVYKGEVLYYSPKDSVGVGEYLASSYALKEASKKTKNKYTHHAIVTDQAIKLKSVTLVERIDVVYMFYQKSLDNIEVLYHHFFHNVFNTLDDFRLAARQLIKENAYLRLDLRTHTIGLYELVKIE